MEDVLAKLREKGRELLVLFTAAAILMSSIMGIIGDAMLILLVGAIGYFLSGSEKK